MKTLKYLFSAVLFLTISVACNGTGKNDQALGSQALKQNDMDTTKKILVVFFSHAGDNYSVGNIKVGNTKIVADYITEITGADQFELVTHKYDGMAYGPLCDLAKEEQQKGELPEYEGTVDVAPYDIIFIGGPIWWGTYPQVMFTFFSKSDLNGKTIVPFATHEGSGLGNTVDDLKRLYPQAKIVGEFAMYGHDVRGGKDRVESWLKGLGF